MIPKILHRVWLDERIPDRFEAYWDRFRDLHPGWVLVTWSTSESLSWMTNLDLFTRQTTWAGKSDIARYEILNRYGGIYVDTDV